MVDSKVPASERAACRASDMLEQHDDRTSGIAPVIL